MIAVSVSWLNPIITIHHAFDLSQWLTSPTAKPQHEPRPALAGATPSEAYAASFEPHVEQRSSTDFCGDPTSMATFMEIFD